MNGIILLDKPTGMTSFDAVSFVRRIVKEKKAGHAGTLDPMATGVLPIFLGEATKAVSLLTNQDKKYTAVLRLGVTTDTGDITGKILTQSTVDATDEEVKKAAAAFKGQIKQIPPMYSAIKINGRHLYDIAREGKEVERSERQITVYDISVRPSGDKTGDYILDVSCSKGTYIRTLCEDIGAKLGCGGTMAALRRTAAAGFDISQCVSTDELKSLSELDKLDDIILSVEETFKDLPVADITPKQAIRFRNGGKLALNRIKESLPQGLCRMVCNGLFTGLGYVNTEADEIEIKCHFNRDKEIAVKEETQNAV